MKNKIGKFITFEGPDGSGKTTQIKILYDLLIDKGYQCVCTREPGGTKVGEKLRDILKDPALNDLLSLQTEALLLQTARAQHVYELIMPALKQGKIVLCDRYADSSTVYQGIGRELGKDVIISLNNFATSGLTPDITFLFDLPPEKGLKRADIRENGGEKDRWEEQKICFHRKIRDAFLMLAYEHKNRFRIINADRDIQLIHSEITSILRDEFRIL